jgi:hypothetical protein
MRMLDEKGGRVNFALKHHMQPMKRVANLHSDPFSAIAGGLPWP